MPGFYCPQPAKIEQFPQLGVWTAARCCTFLCSSALLVFLFVPSSIEGVVGGFSMAPEKGMDSRQLIPSFLLLTLSSFVFYRVVSHRY